MLSETFKTFLILASIMGSTIMIGIWIGKLDATMKEFNKRLERVECKIFDYTDVGLD